MYYHTFKKGTKPEKKVKKIPQNLHRCYRAALSVGNWQSSNDSVKQPQPTERPNLDRV